MPSSKKQAFTLIELLVVIAIIAILAAILFPVFAQAREKARQITCESNAKQFMLGILQYTQDNDEAWPISYAVPNSIGPYASQILGKPTTGVPAEIMPYVKSTEVFHCPDDNGGMAANSDTTCLSAAQETGQTYAQVVGTSYKFTHQNFSNPYPSGSAGATSTGYSIPGTTGGTDIDYGATGQPVTGSTFSDASPVPQGLATVVNASFSRPSETRVYGDFPKVFEDQLPGSTKSNQVPFHKIGTTIAYADGHVKFVIRLSDYMSGCDGVDWAWDLAGTCNSSGLQRAKD